MVIPCSEIEDLFAALRPALMRWFVARSFALQKKSKKRIDYTGEYQQGDPMCRKTCTKNRMKSRERPRVRLFYLVYFSSR
jgi:hypothetical protein